MVHPLAPQVTPRAIVVAALNSGNPTTNRIAPNLLRLDLCVINASLGFPSDVGGRSIEDSRSAVLVYLVQDVSSCLERYR
ncbi:hypothetical protein GQ44DRAFT_614646 [Phaeosphaeriaceae sp. PMI808]|nr:hypothetical protein GQ44DRAFT_614646 [Phaeosphaeriaceae sp. PMI808]